MRKQKVEEGEGKKMMEEKKKVDDRASPVSPVFHCAREIQQNEGGGGVEGKKV